MKHYYFISLWLIATVVSLLCTACHSNHPQIQAAYDLIERVTPGYGNQFQLELIDSENGKDVYEIGSQNGKVLLRGNNPVALATAYNQYLKYTCHAHVSWFVNPEKPDVPLNKNDAFQKVQKRHVQEKR